MIKYIARIYYNTIDPIEVTHETEHFVTIWGNRRKKQSESEMFFDTFQQAKDFLVARLEKKIKYAEDNLRDMRDTLEKLMVSEGADGPM